MVDSAEDSNSARIGDATRFVKQVHEILSRKAAADEPGMTGADARLMFVRLGYLETCVRYLQDTLRWRLFEAAEEVPSEAEVRRAYQEAEAKALIEHDERYPEGVIFPPPLSLPRVTEAYATHPAPSDDEPVVPAASDDVPAMPPAGPSLLEACRIGLDWIVNDPARTNAGYERVARGHIETIRAAIEKAGKAPHPDLRKGAVAVLACREVVEIIHQMDLKAMRKGDLKGPEVTADRLQAISDAANRGADWPDEEKGSQGETP